MRGPSFFACAVAAVSVIAAADARARECATTPMPPDPPGVRTHTKIEKVGSRWRATLEIESARSRGERVLEADSCEALARSTAVVVAMAVAPEREGPSSNDDAAEPAPPPSSPTTPSPDPSGGGERRAEPKTRDERPSRIALRVEAAADGAMLPALTFGGGVTLGLRVGDRLRLEAHAALFADREGRFDADRGAHFSLFSAGARACWSLTRAVDIAPCAGLDVDAIGATGFGAQKVRDGTAFILAPEALLAFRAPVAGPVALAAAAGVLAPLSRESFVITGRGTIHEIPTVALRAFAGPEVRF